MQHRTRSSSPPPLKRARRTTSPPPMENANGHGSVSGSSTHSTGEHQNQHQNQNLQPLSLSILGVEPLDEFIKEIADFVHHMIMTRPEQHQHPNGKVEVEAKIGVLRENRSGQRLGLPVLVETSDTCPGIPDVRFESNMSVGGDRDKIRVTRDTNTGVVVECMRKVRLGDLNVYCPKREADWRVSVNLEIPMPHPVGSASFKRVKDRLSYSHEEFKIDLTQVTSSTSPNAPPQILHELELEIARPEFLLATAMQRGDPKASELERSAFDELIRAFVNNARILVRNASEGWQ
ncbi:CYTH-like domain-containing protein [Gymnopilus junonius]|uniref:mRNA-capping enzyme subunit beta n=1 Tax=Gymnopilus junonius TaxID=109634 RepID=A0A9P5NBN7_GYMJU|nr:CYTH-like domain-containing protein [Gymnopilus junonius]